MEGGKEAFDSSAMRFLLRKLLNYQFMDIRTRVSEASDGGALPASAPLRLHQWQDMEMGEIPTSWPTMKRSRSYTYVA